MVSSNSNNIQVIDDISNIPAEQWNACVNADEPFARHEFLSALEDSKCVDAQTGWHAQHLVLKDEQDIVRACAPIYLKGHSYGEYVFDWSWADAYERAGGNYYPKLQNAIPFTPVTGHRILLHPEHSPQDLDVMISAMIALAQKIGTSSFHTTFSTENEISAFAKHGFLPREGHQYHWKNRDYSNFDDFLNEFSSRKRKNIKKERKSVYENGIKFQTLIGHEITDKHWDIFYQFYRDTSGRKWGHPYLNREFFSLLNERLGDHVVLVLALHENRVVAGALNLKGSETLYGRYWGCLEDFKFLHFETCYYQAIDFAIKYNLKTVEAGAQGQHKIQRGYLPVTTYSAHWIAHDGFKNAVIDFLEHDRRVNQAEMKELAKFSPFKQ